MRNEMKHYRFKPSKTYSFKQKLTTSCIVMLLLYISAWCYLGYRAKESLITQISNFSKETLSLHYSDVELSGFPFNIKLHINNAKLTIDASKAAEIIASMVEKQDDPFPKLAYRQVYSSIDEPIIITKSLFKKNYKIVMPEEIVVKHYLENQEPINLIYKISSKPEMLIELNGSKSEGKLNFLSYIKSFNLIIPSYELKKLDGDDVIIQSQGLSSKIKLVSDNKFYVKHTNNGTRYTNEISSIIDPFSKTEYLKHISRTMPMQYEEMVYIKKYTDAGERKSDVSGYFIANEIDDEIKLEIDLKKIEQLDEYGSLNGSCIIKAAINPDKNKLHITHDGYFAVTLKDAWHKKWINTIDRSFQKFIKSPHSQLNSLREKLKALLPNLHNYKYATLSYKTGYDGKLKTIEKSALSIDHLKIQTDQFIIDLKKGNSFGEDFHKLPLNFILKINNSKTVLNIALDYLHTLIDTKVDNKHTFNNKIFHNFTSFLNEIKHKDSVCKNNWHGQLKSLKGEWYLENYRLSTIQSIIISIMSSGVKEYQSEHK